MMIRFVLGLGKVTTANYQEKRKAPGTRPLFLKLAVI
jgi:hypothetical protein